MLFRVFENYKFLEKIVIILLLFTILFQNLVIAYNSSVTWDEKCYIGTGKYLFETGNVKYNALGYHPPLSYYLNSVFLLPLNFGENAFKTEDCWETGREMIFYSKYSPRLITFLSRLPFIFISLIFSLFVLQFAKNLYGAKSGIIAMSLYTFSTSILSYSNLVMTDFLVAFFIFLTIFYLFRFTKSKKNSDMYLTGLSIGLAILTKASALILIPITILIFLKRFIDQNTNKKHILKTIKELSIIFLISFLVIWAGYGFAFKPIKDIMPAHYLARAYEEFDKTFPDPLLNDVVIFAFEKVPLPFPSFFYDIGHVTYLSKEGIGTFFNGKITKKTDWYYPFAVFFMKTQTSLLILLFISLFSFRKLRDEYFIIIPIIFIFIFFAFNKMTAGMRHILVIYPFLIVFVSQLYGHSLKLKKPIYKVFLMLVLIYYMLSSVFIFPNPIAYFNEFFGGPSGGYQYLVGSNIDQGQSIYQLKDFMEENNINKINLSYFGSVDPGWYGLNYDYMPSPYFQHWVPDYVPHVTPIERNEDCSVRKGWVAISVTNLQNVHLINKTCFNWLKNLEPVERVGYSILVYNLNEYNN